MTEEGPAAIPSPLITPALFSHRPPTDREKREQSGNAPGVPLSPGRWEGDGREGVGGVRVRRGTGWAGLTRRHSVRRTSIGRRCNAR
jgi:hypothetical protein